MAYKTKNIEYSQEQVVDGTAILRINRLQYDQALRDGCIPVFYETKSVASSTSETVAKPIVGITGTFVGEGDAILARREAVMAIEDEFFPIIIYAGMEPELIYKCQQLISGLIIPGGQNLNPFWFNETDKTPDFASKEFAQDVLEFRMVAWALANDVPVLGICRGMQIIAALAGYLVTDVSSDEVHHSDIEQRYANLTRAESLHRIQLANKFLQLIEQLPSDDPLAQWLASLHNLTVTSMHHQGMSGEEPNPNWNNIKAIDTIDPLDPAIELNVLARSTDNVAEAIWLRNTELEKVLAIAFQGHPEVGKANPQIQEFFTAAFGFFKQMVENDSI